MTDGGERVVRWRSQTPSFLSLLFLDESPFDLQLGRGMTISPSLKEEQSNQTNGVNHSTIPYGRLLRAEAAISLPLSLYL